MFIYWLILPIIVLFYLFFNKHNNLFIISSFLLLGIISALRSSVVGSDTALYEFLFFNPKLLGDKSPIYTSYSEFLKLLSNNQHTITISNSILICTLFAIFFIRLKQKNIYSLYSIFLFVTMFFWGNSLCTSRQYVAMGLFVNGVLYLFQKKYIRFFVLALLSIGVHAISVVGVFVFLIFLMKQNKKSLLIFVILLISIVLFYNKLPNLFVNIFSDYNMYTDGTNNLQISTSGAGAAIIYNSFIFIVFCLLIFLVYKNKIELNHMEFNLLCIFSVFVILDLFMYNVVFLQRIFMFYSIFGVVVIPLLFSKIKKVLDFRIYYFFNGAFTITMLAYYYIQLSHDYIGIVPYILK